MKKTTGRMPCLPYEAQLEYLQACVEQLTGGPPAATAKLRVMLLSIASSVKQARECNLNHREVPE
jgi:hypothetical protein